MGARARFVLGAFRAGPGRAWVVCGQAGGYGMRVWVVLWLVVAVGGAAQFAHAAPGGVDARGCHNSKAAGHHCHPERAKSGATLPGGETVTQREKRLKRECKGKPNAGACLGYATR